MDIAYAKLLNYMKTHLCFDDNHDIEGEQFEENLQNEISRLCIYQYSVREFLECDLDMCFSLYNDYLNETFQRTPVQLSMTDMAFGIMQMLVERNYNTLKNVYLEEQTPEYDDEDDEEDGDDDE